MTRPNHPSPNRIEHHVAAQLQQVTVLFNQNGCVPSLKPMPHLTLAPVGLLRIDPIKLPNPLGQMPLRGFDQQMIMVIHEAVGVA